MIKNLSFESLFDDFIKLESDCNLSKKGRYWDMVLTNNYGEFLEITGFESYEIEDIVTKIEIIKGELKND